MIRQHHNVRQGSPEWLALRAGRLTASSLGDLFTARLAPSNSATRESLILTAAYERITGKPARQSRAGAAAEWGHLNEPEARAYYEADTFDTVEPGGFWTLGDTLGASPDGLIHNPAGLGILEIKCPYTPEAVMRLRSCRSWEELVSVNKDYAVQVQAQLLVTGAAICTFIVYDPDMRHQHYIYCLPDPAFHAALIAEAERAEAEIREIVEKDKKNR